MTSISNFEESIKSAERPSDLVLNSLNRIYEAKLNNVLDENELSKSIVLTGNLFANKVRQGKVLSDEMESTKTTVEKLRKEYFTHKHNDLATASDIYIEGIDAALDFVATRNLSAQPVLTQTDYNRTFQKLR